MARISLFFIVFFLFGPVLGLILPDKTETGDGLLETVYPDRLKLCHELTGETTITFHLFNLTNPTQFQNPKEPELQKPIFEQVGPFVYKETRNKEKCLIGAYDFSVTFEDKRSVYILDNVLPNDIINTVNIPFQRYGQEIYLKDLTSLTAAMSTMTLVGYGENYIRENVSISDLLMGGVDVTLYNRYVNDPGYIGRDRLPELEKETFAVWPEIKVPKKLMVSSNMDTFGKILQIDDQTTLPWWTSDNNNNDTEQLNPICGQIGGGDGGSFYGKITKTTPLHFYSEELCSTVPIIFHQEVTLNDITAYVFLFPDNLLDSSVCFCPETDKTKCLPPGAIDGKYCRDRMPYIMSNPHFLYADPSYTVNMTGMTPEIYNHQSYFIIEPLTGTVLESSRKFQLNVNLTKLPREVDRLAEISVPNTIFPVFWTDKFYKLDSKSMGELRQFLEEQQQTTIASTTTTSITDVPAIPTTTTSNAFLIDSLAQFEYKLDSFSKNLQEMTTFLYVLFSFLMLVMGVVVIQKVIIRQKTGQRQTHQTMQQTLPNYTPQQEWNKSNKY